jgi:hypothetical protein
MGVRGCQVVGHLGCVVRPVEWWPRSYQSRPTCRWSTQRCVQQRYHMFGGRCSSGEKLESLVLHGVHRVCRYHLRSGPQRCLGVGRGVISPDVPASFGELRSNSLSEKLIWRMSTLCAGRRRAPSAARRHHRPAARVARLGCRHQLHCAWRALHRERPFRNGVKGILPGIWWVGH